MANFAAVPDGEGTPAKQKEVKKSVMNATFRYLGRADPTPSGPDR